MAKSVKGTQTEKNLLTSFAGESQARMRYTYFASTAKKEGYEQIAAIFTETADQEKEHAKRMFKWLEGGMVEITVSYLFEHDGCKVYRFYDKGNYVYFTTRGDVTSITNDSTAQRTITINKTPYE